MTRDQLINAICAEPDYQTFGTDFAGYFDISYTESVRLAEASESYADFIRMWENEDWWKDDKAAWSTYAQTGGTTMTDTEYETMWNELEHDARELMTTGEPNLCAAYDGFLRTMWPDDEIMNRYGATREEFEGCLGGIYDKLRDPGQFDTEEDAAA